MKTNRFTHLPEDKRLALHVGLLIVEAAVEHARGQKDTTPPPEAQSDRPAQAA